MCFDTVFMPICMYISMYTKVSILCVIPVLYHISYILYLILRIHLILYHIRITVGFEPQVVEVLESMGGLLKPDDEEQVNTCV